MKQLIVGLSIFVSLNVRAQSSSDTTTNKSHVEVSSLFIGFSSPMQMDTPRTDDIVVNGIRIHHQANCSNCDIITAMGIAGYNYNKGVFTKRDDYYHERRTMSNWYTEKRKSKPHHKKR